MKLVECVFVTERGKGKKGKIEMKGNGERKEE